mgnify:CR=1 FL=1
MRLRFGVYRHEAVGKKFAELLCGWRKECNNSMADNTGVRINKFLSEAGVCSRRLIEWWSRGASRLMISR